MKKIIIISCIFFMIDLISKIIVKNILVIGKSICIIKNFFYITYINNYGAAFSIMDNSRIILIIIAVVILFIIINYIKKNNVNNRLELISYSLVIGGLVGNLFDRIIYGYVIDFFDFYIFGYDFAVFNIADVAIVIGIFLLIIDNIRRSDRNDIKG